MLSVRVLPGILAPLSERWTCFLARKGIDTLAQQGPIMAVAKDTLEKLSADPRLPCRQGTGDALHFYRIDLQITRGGHRSKA